MYRGEKFFIQGFEENCSYKLYLDRWEPPANDYIGKQDGDTTSFSVDDLLNARLWNGRSFWETENGIECVDS